MPIRINLKEIFSSDPQEILVDKLNFNYNKLLELGVGTPGPIGTTGPQGAAGPIGLTGPQGDRGATWWVDSGDPNTLTFTGLIDGDLYLDQTSNVFQIWKYDAGTSIWTQVVSIAAIVNSYLNNLSSIPFETVTTTQNPGSTAVNKFILFDKRDDSTTDSTRGIANTSLNNILFLNNFDEADLLYPTLGQTQYNSLLSIFPAHDDTQLSGKAQSGRYHIELGSLYMDNDIIPLGTIKYSELKHNLKIKFYKQYIDPILPPQLPLTNSWINTARFSLSYTEDQSIADIDQNGAFEFLFPKWNNEGMSPIKEGISVIFASSEAIVEKSPAHNHIVADGIHVSTTNSSVNATFGLALDYSSLNAKLSGKNHLMLDSNSGVDGVILLNKETFVNGDMNIVDGLAIGAGYEDLTAPANSLIVENKIGVGIATPDANTRHHIYETGVAGVKLPSLTQLDSLSFSGFIKFLTINTISANDITGYPFTVLQNNVFIGNNQINNFTGSYIDFQNTSTHTFNGTQFIGNRIDLLNSSQFTTASSSLEIAGNLFTLSPVITASSNGRVYGNKFVLQPDLSSATGGSIRGNQIEITSYSPNATSQVFGTRHTIEQLSAIPQGETYGAFTSIQVNSVNSLSSDLVGQQINLNTTGVFLPNSSYGSSIIMGGTLPVGSINGRIFGNNLVLQPDLSSATGGSIRGNQIEITSYSPNATSQVFGTRHTIEQLSAIPQGETYGAFTSIQVDSTNSSSSDLIGHQINVNTTGIQLPTTSYGVKVIFGGNLPLVGKSYGLHITGASNNLIEGTTELDGEVQMLDASIVSLGTINISGGGATGPSVVLTISAEDYDRSIYLCSSNTFGNVQLLDGGFAIEAKIGFTSVFYKIATNESSIADPNIKAVIGTHNIITNTCYLLPAGQSSTIELTRFTGTTIAYGPYVIDVRGHKFGK